MFEEMSKDLCECYTEVYGGHSEVPVFDANATAQKMITKGYRKQSENVIELPCKVGDILYDIYDGEEIREIKVREINVRLDNRNKAWLIISGYYYAFDDFNETVFFTREEAEAKMKGGAE